MKFILLVGAFFGVLVFGGASIQLEKTRTVECTERFLDKGLPLAAAQEICK